MQFIDDENEIICGLCKQGDHEDELILCDGPGCNASFHTYCLNLPAVPIDDWHCPACKILMMSLNKNNVRKVPSYGMNIIVYLRVSSKGQDKKEFGRVGIDTQNHAVLKYAYDNNLKIRRTFDDVGTGTTMNKRLSFQRMLKVLQPGQSILVYNVARFGRNLPQVVEFLKQIHKKGCYVYSVADELSSSDTRFLNLVKQAAEESVTLSRMVTESINRRRLAGIHIGPAPYGKTVYRDKDGNRRLTDNLEETAILQYIRQCVEQDENITKAEILDMLAEREILYRGRPWSISILIRILKMLELTVNNRRFDNEMDTDDSDSDSDSDSDDEEIEIPVPRHGWGRGQRRIQMQGQMQEQIQMPQLIKIMTEIRTETDMDITDQDDDVVPILIETNNTMQIAPNVHEGRDEFENIMRGLTLTSDLMEQENKEQEKPRRPVRRCVKIRTPSLTDEDIAKILSDLQGKGKEEV